MKTVLTAILACGTWIGGYAADTVSPRADYLTVQERIDAEYRVARERCHALAGNAQDVCYAEAKAKERIDRTAAAARIENTPRAHYDARVARAEAQYHVAKERCNDHGAEKESCIREAEAVENRAKAQANAELRAAEDVVKR